LDINYILVAELTIGQTSDADKIKEGADVYFECNIDAKPAIYKISWWFNGVELKQNVREGVIMGNQSLLLQSLTRDNTGTYSCQATNTIGKGRSSPRFLLTHIPPIKSPWTRTRTRSSSTLQPEGPSHCQLTQAWGALNYFIFVYFYL